jgi:predicted MFS family arabinose efflux permease
MGTTRNRDGHRAVAAVLFLCLFAGQAGLIALSPVLAEVAHDLGVSTAAAGQLRTVAGLVAGVTALGLNRVGSRLGVGRQLLAGAGLLALGSLWSALAPSFALLAAAQVPVGAGVAALTTAGAVAAAEWVPADRRTSVLSWALIGQPAAWIVGMPLLGVVAERSWRYGWLALPFAAALIAAVALRGRAGARRAQAERVPLAAVLGDRRLARRLAAELLANSAWAGLLVYAGALLVECHGASSELAGAVLALAAGAYVVGNLALRRLAGRASERLIAALALALAVTSALFGALRPSLAVSAALFSAAALAAGGRTLISSSLGLSAPPALRPAAMSLRAASMQLGYFVGSFAAGTALGIGGYVALGATVGALFLTAAAVLAAPPRPRRRAGRRRATVVASAPQAWSSGFSAPSR